MNTGVKLSAIFARVGVRLRDTHIKTHIKFGAVGGIGDKTNLVTKGGTRVATLE